ncbi:MAG: aspartate ammonia-lyase [Patescibacteria group bacterium]|jgi:aspartate ammonia-lyase
MPQKIYYGEQTKLALSNFNVSRQKASLYWVKKIVEVKKAANQANFELGKISKGKYALIDQAIKKIQTGKYDDQFVTPAIQGGAGTSINMNVNEVIAGLANELAGKKDAIHYLNDVNLSQSTNDVLPTALKMAIYELAENCIESLKILEKSLAKKSREFSDVIKTGRTHLQDAVPMTLGQEFEAYRMVALRGIARLERVRKGMLDLSIGGTAVGTGINAGKKYTALVIKNLRKNTGLPVKSASDLIDATQNVDSFGDISAGIKTTLAAITKNANDLRLLASGPTCGLGEIKLPERQKGSTIMPGKVNPVVPELINQIAFQVYGNDLAVTMVIEAGQLELNVFMSVLAHNLIESLRFFSKGIKILAQDCIDGIKANKETCERYALRNTTLLTSLTPVLGYDKVAQIIKKINSAPDLSIRQALTQEKVDKKIIDDLLDVKKLLSKVKASAKI